MGARGRVEDVDSQDSAQPGCSESQERAGQDAR